MDACAPPRSRSGFSSFALLARARASQCLATMLLALMLLAPASAWASDWAPPRTVYVPETGQTTDGLFLDLWRAQRAVLGDPITPEIKPEWGWRSEPAQGRIVQYYENAALLYLPDEPPEARVQLLALGRDALAEALAGKPSLALLRAAERTVCAGNDDGCVGFAENGHTLGGAFLAYWDAGAGTVLGAPLTEAFRAPDGSLIQYFDHGALQLKASGDVQPLPLGRHVASRLQLDTSPIEPPNDVPPYDEALFVPPPVVEERPADHEQPWSVGTFGPGPQQGAWKEIVVSISQQAMWAYENGELMRSSYVSTGTGEVVETVTPLGYWSILTKYDIQDMEGTISDEYYFVEAVPDVMYFDNLGNALHGAYWHNNFGSRMSHGCVNLPLEVAAWLYDWAPIGTAVSVIA